MSNVVAFPGVTLPETFDTGYPILPEEAAYVSLAYVALMLTQPTMSDGVFEYGLSDEGDGWLAGQTIHRKNASWIDQHPTLHMMRDKNGFHARFYLNVDYSDPIISGSTIQSVFETRAPKLQIAMMTLMYKHHEKHVRVLGNEMAQYPERITSTTRKQQGLENIDYAYVKYVSETATEEIQKQFDNILRMANG